MSFLPCLCKSLVVVSDFKVAMSHLLRLGFFPLRLFPIFKRKSGFSSFLVSFMISALALLSVIMKMLILPIPLGIIHLHPV